MTTWFTSDLHFGHVRINELAGRPFTSVEACDRFMIDEWNVRVDHSDDVIVLGDLCLGKFAESIKSAAQLHGVKHLVPGNHDRVSSLYHGSPAKKVEWRQAYVNAGFHILTEWRSNHLLVEDVLVDLCHFPFEGDSHGDDRYTKARPLDRGQWLLHGHVHEAWKVNGRQVNVGVDVWDFAPVSERELVEVIRESDVHES